MKKIILIAFLIPCLFACKSETKSSLDLTNEKKEIEVANNEISESKLRGDSARKDAAHSKVGEVIQKRQEQNRLAKEESQKKIKNSNNTTENYEDSYSSDKSIELGGIYRCSNEDMIRLNANGTGKMMMSYNFDGVRSFTWEYDSQEEKLSIRSEGQGYEMPPIYLTLNLRMTSGRVAFEHYTAGPTFLYIKQ